MRKIAFIAFLFWAFLLIAEDRTIVVIYTNDAHCAVERDVGYAGLAAFKKEMQQTYPYVTLVDCGDATQGAVLGTVSKGDAIVEIMNAIGYDLGTLGNHAFDYGIPVLRRQLENSKATYLNCNILYTGKKENPLSKTIPYKILDYGQTKVAYLGVTTQRSVFSSAVSIFEEDGVLAYDFSFGNNKQKFFDTITCYATECREKGADYVVLLSHLGVDEDCEPWTSNTLIENTAGIDVVLDGHSHTFMPCEKRKNKDGKNVLLSQTGAYLYSIGQMLINPTDPENGITLTCITNYTKKDPQTEAFIQKIKEKYTSSLKKVVAHLDKSLSTFDENGIRIVRCRECGLANLCVDAFRHFTGADIGILNGGGVRSALKGDVTYESLLDVQPFANTICTMELKGSEILDILEYDYCVVRKDYVKDGVAFGEAGVFAQLSGIKCVVDTSIPSSVEYDADGAFIKVNGKRRVSEVYVLKNGKYEPLNPEQTYILVSHENMLEWGGCGMKYFLKNNKTLKNTGKLDYELVAEYIRDVLKGDLSAYEKPEGRVVIK